ncbi:unnamed protein product [Vitrella brassicaformis CCMP3155]|uniref:Uncharacterized protein n=1 Tax=Vitrella brassicaformis (strain CCMP3155) TaxID=1169540 RepID=A0A0G4EE68_VITBC|nr:unnamed protein product [Vitrella brassicaformis CCMP3155]|eukprot:CEL94034.1 unnamed protein product [Vitrella brassicaformis CCMP3155]
MSVRNSSILVAHTPSIGVNPFIRRLTGHTAPTDDNNRGKPSPASLLPWRIETKYYEADVTIMTRPLAMDHRPLEAMEADNGVSIEAIVAVIEEGGLRVLQEDAGVMTRLREWADNDADKIAVVACEMEEDDGAASADHLRSWCIEHSIELVPFTESDDSQPAGPFEKHGIARIREALHCHMWPSMRRRQQPTSSPAPPLAASPTQQQDEGQNGAKEPSAPSASTADAASSSAPVDERVSIDRIARGLREGKDCGWEDHCDGDDHEDERDHLLAEMDRLTEKIRAVREDGANLSDEARRERAAHVAMELSRFLGEADSDEDERDSND